MIPFYLGYQGSFDLLPNIQLPNFEVAELLTLHTGSSKEIGLENKLRFITPSAKDIRYIFMNYTRLCRGGI